MITDHGILASLSLSRRDSFGVGEGSGVYDSSSRRLVEGEVYNA